MTFHLIANIKCIDKSEGELVAVIFHPEQQRLTHLVTRYHDEQRIVPVEHIISFDEHTIQLRCDKAEMQTMEPFAEEHFIHVQHPEQPSQAPGEYPMGYSPHLVPLDTDVVPLVVEHVPEGELVIHRNAPVEATDGPIGYVSGLQLTWDDKRVTRLIVQTSGRLKKHELGLPLTAIASITDDGIYLKENKQMIEHWSERL